MLFPRIHMQGVFNKRPNVCCFWHCTSLTDPISRVCTDVPTADEVLHLLDCEAFARNVSFYLVLTYVNQQYRHMEKHADMWKRSSPYIQSVSFMFSPNTVDLSHRQPAATGTLRGCRRTQSIDEGDNAVTPTRRCSVYSGRACALHCTWMLYCLTDICPRQVAHVQRVW
jgi:hypothetical protein